MKMNVQRVKDVQALRADGKRPFEIQSELNIDRTQYYRAISYFNKRPDIVEN